MRVCQFQVILILVLNCLVGMGCRTLEDRIKEKQSLFDSYPAEVQQKIRNEQVDVGFTREMVLIALDQPDTIYTRKDQSGITREVWSYRGVYYVRTHLPRHDYYCDRCRKHDCGIAGHRRHHDHEVREYDRLRLEFVDDKVKVMEKEFRK